MDGTEKYTGILLAGGRSRRMGREKGFIPVGKGMLYQYPLRILEDFCDEILVSSCKDFPHREQHPVICDEIAGIGPLGGLHTCLKRARHERCLVLSYDMPLIGPELFRHLLAQGRNEGIVVPAYTPDRPEPLCGLYDKRVVPLLETHIEKGQFALYRILHDAGALIVPVGPDLPFFREDLFLNINEEKDLEKLPPTFGHAKQG